jgi:hypothetical protein
MINHHSLTSRGGETRSEKAKAGVDPLAEREQLQKSLPQEKQLKEDTFDKSVQTKDIHDVNALRLQR